MGCSPANLTISAIVDRRGPRVDTTKRSVLFQIARKGRKLEVKSICLRSLKVAGGGIDHPLELYRGTAPQNSIESLVCHPLLFTKIASARVPWYAISKWIVFSDVRVLLLVCQVHSPKTHQVVSSTGYDIKVGLNCTIFLHISTAWAGMSSNSKHANVNSVGTAGQFRMFINYKF